MTKNKRVVLFLFSLALLILIFYFWTGSPLPNSVWATVIFTSLIMLSFVMLFLEHWFTKPTDVLTASLSILLLLAPLKTELVEFGIWYNIFFIYNLAMVICALIALLTLDRERSTVSLQNRISLNLSNFVAAFGNGRLLYFTLFVLTMLFYIDSQSSFFVVLFAYSTCILLADPKRFVFAIMKQNHTGVDEIGEIIGVQSKNIFLAKLHKERKPVRRFDFVEFRYSMEDDRNVRKGLIIDNYFLNQEQWIKILTTSDIAMALGQEVTHNGMTANIVYKIEPADAAQILDRFVGVVVEDTNILRLRFEYGAKVAVAEGTLLEVPIGEISVLYQIVQGVTDTELLESKNEAGLILGQATQLGTWNEQTLRFDRFGWVPEVNSPVYLAGDVPPVEPSEEELLIGHIPGTSFPILLRKKDAITHHIAILGVTGSGKSVFARNLIRELAADGTKFICVDFTGEYSQRFADLEAQSVVESDASEAMFGAIDAISKEMAKFPNQRDHKVIADSEDLLLDRFQAGIRDFLNSDAKIAIFELPDVSNTTGILDYTRWFFKALFQIAKAHNNYGKQVCVVLEEAHTVVPEWNFIGSDDKGAQALVNSIGQIALQGRKYGIGFVVIAQRTANVSKTVLTQCNSIVAFQQFDKTSAEFLTNYMSGDMVDALPLLKDRQAIAVGKAFRSGSPVIFQVPDIVEFDKEEEQARGSG